MTAFDDEDTVIHVCNDEIGGVTGGAAFDEEIFIPGSDDWDGVFDFATAARDQRGEEE